MLLKSKVERRTYGQFCGLARALDVVGERWTLLIVRNLLAGPLRYGELQSTLPGITTNLLAKRLKEMQAAELIERDDVRYRLAARGRALEAAVMALGAWGGRYLEAGPREHDVVEIRWGMVSFKRRYRGTHEGTAQFNIGDRRFVIDYGPDAVEVIEDVGQPDAPREAALRVRGTLPAFQAWLFRGKAPRGLSIEGRGFKKFCSSFGLGPE